MRRSRARPSELESSVHAQSLADFITNMSGLRFSVHTHTRARLIVVPDCMLHASNEISARQRHGLCHPVLVVRGHRLGSVRSDGCVGCRGASLSSAGTIPRRGTWTHIPKEPITTAKPEPAEPSEPPVQDPQPYTDPVRTPPGDPSEDRPMRDPITPGGDQPRS